MQCILYGRDFERHDLSGIYSDSRLDQTDLTIQHSKLSTNLDGDLVLYI